MFLDALKKKHTVRNICVGSLAFVVVSFLLAVYSKGISGNDFWWHVKVGEWICTNLTVPTTDVFSWYGIEHSLNWTAHEWLSDVVYYLLLKGVGELGIFLFSLGSALLMLCLIWKEVRLYARSNILLSSIYFLAMPLVLYIFFYGRPHLFSFFFLFFELKCLYKFVNDQNSKAIYFIPLISCLWSNFHGGSSNLSYLLCFVFLLVGLLPENIGRLYSTRWDKKSFLKLLAVSVASVLAILVNPIGLDLLLYPYVNMGDSLMLSLIAEWASPDAKDMLQLVLFFLPIFVTTIGFIIGEKKIRTIDVLMMLVFFFLFFRSIRFIMLWYIAAAFYAFRYMPRFELTRINKYVKIGASALAVVLFSVVSVYSVSQIKQLYTEEKLISEVMTDEMIDFIKQDEPERLFNDYNFGEALIYNDIKVFFDARADIYAADHLLANGVSLQSLNQYNSEAATPYVDVEQLILQYDFDAILIWKSRPLYSYLLSHSDQYTCLYTDDSAAYFRVNIDQ